MESVAPMGQLRACISSFLIRLPSSSVFAPPSRSEIKNSPIDGTNTSTQPATMPGTVSGTVKVGTDSYSNTTVKGVSEVYFDILGYTIDEGRLLNYVDLENNKKVCVVGAYINRVAYGGNAVGQTIKIGSTRYTIVSVLEAKVTEALVTSAEGVHI